MPTENCLRTRSWTLHVTRRRGCRERGACECSYSLARPPHGLHMVNNARAIKVTRCNARCLQLLHHEHHTQPHSKHPHTNTHTHITHIDHRPELLFTKLLSGVAAIGSRAVWLASPVPPKASLAARAASRAPQNHPLPRPHRWWRYPREFQQHLHQSEEKANEKDRRGRDDVSILIPGGFGCVFTAQSLKQSTQEAFADKYEHY